jgi:hypothetical protein
MEAATKPVSRIRKVNIDDLKRDFQFYPRESVDYSTVSRFMDAMRSGAKFPPITVCDNTARIIDGFHRYAAYQQLGIKQVDAIAEQPANDAEFFFLAISANKAHGLGYSSTDQNKIVKLALRLGLEREKIALACALPIQKIEEMTRNVPRFATDDPPPTKGFSTARSVSLPTPTVQPLRTVKKADPITASGFLFYCSQVIRFLRSDLCDCKDEKIFEKVRELESAVASQLNPNKLKERILEKVREGAATIHDLSMELFLPESQIKAMVEELEATGKLGQLPEGRRTENQRGATGRVLVVQEEPQGDDPQPRDQRAAHKAIQAYKTATGRYPNKLLYDKVIEALGDFPDVTRLNQVHVEWVGRGYNPQNINWLDWYVKGIPERNGNGNGKNQQRESASSRNVRNIKDSLDYLSGVQSDGGQVDPKGKTGLLASGS